MNSNKFTDIDNLKNSLCCLRHDIDQIDNEILTLLEKREDCVIEIGKIKRLISKQPEYFVPEREKEIIDRVTSTYKGKFQLSEIKKIYNLIIENSRLLQK